jgi:hypothetical protein
MSLADVIQRRTRVSQGSEDMESQIDFHKSAFIKARIKELQASDPKLTFREAWNKVQKEQPVWFKEARTGAAEYGEVRQPHIKLGVQTKGSLSKVQSADYIFIRREDEGQLQRIEAALR